MIRQLAEFRIVGSGFFMNKDTSVERSQPSRLSELELNACQGESDWDEHPGVSARFASPLAQRIRGYLIEDRAAGTHNRIDSSHVAIRRKAKKELSAPGLL